MNRIKLFLKESWTLIAASILFGSLLAFTNAAWEPRIRENEIKKFTLLAGGLLPKAERFEAIEEPVVIQTAKGKVYTVTVQEALDAGGSRVGWAFTAEGPGFADIIKLVIGVEADFQTLAGWGVLSSNETPGFGDKINITGGFFPRQFQGAPAQMLSLSKTGDDSIMDEQIVSISGATITSQAVVDIVNTFVVPVQDELKKRGLIE